MAKVRDFVSGLTHCIGASLASIGLPILIVTAALKGDAYDVVAPCPDGSSAAKAMEFALKDAGIKPEEVQYINTHGTSTHLGDIAETQAIARVFGDKTKNPNLKISSTKSETGHMLGASGAAESVICIKTIA